MQGQTLDAHGEKLEILKSSDFATIVQGELDKEELADIRKLLEALETSAAGFFSPANPKDF